MDDLVRWLGEQLDEDERIARAADPELSNVFMRVEVFDPEMAADERHIVLHGPARVLREIDAKRQQLVEHAPGRPKGRPNMEPHCLTCTTAQAWDESANQSNCLTLRLLALPYADRPGYREEWRP